jgi:hypothetical protein
MAFPKEMKDHSTMGNQDVKGLHYRRQEEKSVPSSYSSSSSTSSRRFQYEWRPYLRMRLVWIGHFVVSVLVIQSGCKDNPNRKYVPIDVTTLDSTTTTNSISCSKAFINVFATSIDDPSAFICCGGGGGGGKEIDGTTTASVIGTSTSSSTLSSLSSSTFDDIGICTSPRGIFLLSKRLSYFPEAWLLPLFPLLIRFVFSMVQHFYYHQQQQYQSTSHDDDIATFWRIQNQLARRRFYLYIVLIQVRGWILYLLFNTIEDYFLSSTSTSSLSSSVNDCWYEKYLYPNHTACHGQLSDFSDHIVLYYSQILPIPLTEVVHSFVVPYWRRRRRNHPTTNTIISTNSIHNNNNDSTNTSRSSTTRHSATRSFLPTAISAPTTTSIILPTILLCGMMYLYIITFVGSYKTSAYFHTNSEIWYGYVVSMVIQVPLCVLQCTPFRKDVSLYFFG